MHSEEHPDDAYGLVDFDSPYAFGYVNQARLRRGSPGRVWPPRRDAWLTIMSYYTQCDDWGFYCYELPRFSSPRWNHHGDPGVCRGIAHPRGLTVPPMRSESSRSSPR